MMFFAYCNCSAHKPLQDVPQNQVRAEQFLQDIQDDNGAKQADGYVIW